MEAALAALAIAQAAWAAAVKAGLITDPNWQSAGAVAAMAMAKAWEIFVEVKGGATHYDHLTPDEIRALLLPTGLTELERQVAAELGL